LLDQMIHEMIVDLGKKEEHQNASQTSIDLF